MKSDEEIAREKNFLTAMLGPTRAGWYEEACLLEVPSTTQQHEVMVWACRVRELAMALGRNVEAQLIHEMKEGIT